MPTVVQIVKQSPFIRCAACPCGLTANTADVMVNDVPYCQYCYSDIRVYPEPRSARY